MHSMCVTHGPLAHFKVHVRTYGGKKDEDLNKTTAHTGSIQKFINLLDEFLEDFKGRGHHVTMDSAYMGDLMALSGIKVWLVNMLGTCQSNRVGADIAAAKKAMKRGTYEAIQWQHISENLNAAIWADNNIVSTLSNYHSPIFLDEGTGMRRRKKSKEGIRDREQSEVKCPAQNKDYSETFRQIDAGNGKEQRYDLKFESKLHNWSPKLVFRLFGINSQNARSYYLRLVRLYTPDRVPQDYRQCMQRWTHHMLQRGDNVRTQRAEHPAVKKDLSTVHSTGQGRRRRSDARIGRGTTAPTQETPEGVLTLSQLVTIQKKKSPWRIHQSKVYHKQGRCDYKKCPNLAICTGKRKRAYDTFRYCEECSAKAGKVMYFCNDVKGKGEDGKRKLCLCHEKYHKQECDY